MGRGKLVPLQTFCGGNEITYIWKYILAKYVIGLTIRQLFKSLIWMNAYGI